MLWARWRGSLWVERPLVVVVYFRWIRLNFARDYVYHVQFGGVIFVGLTRCMYSNFFLEWIPYRCDSDRTQIPTVLHAPCSNSAGPTFAGVIWLGKITLKNNVLYAALQSSSSKTFMQSTRGYPRQGKESLIKKRKHILALLSAENSFPALLPFSPWTILAFVSVVSVFPSCHCLIICLRFFGMYEPFEPFRILLLGTIL